MVELVDESIRLQVLLERVKAGEDRRIDAFLREEARLLSAELKRANLSPGRTARVEALLEQVREALQALHGRRLGELRERLEELGELMADTEAKSLAAALSGWETATPTAKAVTTALNTAPLSVRGAGGGMLLEAFLKGAADADIERVTGAIRRGYFEGRTTEQVVRDVIGTKAANYRDGILDMSRRNARTVVHTGLQHVANTARAETMKANEDIVKGYRWVSTLDSRTSEICQALDGRQFDLGEGPVPPAHPNCRSTIVPVTKTWKELGIDVPEMAPGERASQDGPVSSTLTYYGWLKTQPASFVEEALGTTRAALFLRGGLDAEEFARLQLNRNFEPLTLAELREKAPKVFERAGV